MMGNPPGRGICPVYQNPWPLQTTVTGIRSCVTAEKLPVTSIVTSRSWSVWPANWMGVGVGVAVGVGVVVGVGVEVGNAILLMYGRYTWAGRVAMGVGVSVGVSVTRGVEVAVAVAVKVGVRVTAGVPVAVGETVAVKSSITALFDATARSAELPGVLARAPTRARTAIAAVATVTLRFSFPDTIASVHRMTGK